MPKRRRLLSPMKKKNINNKPIVDRASKEESTTPRGRLKGALLDALDPFAEESDVSVDQSPIKWNSQDKEDARESSEESERPRWKQHLPRQSYVLKLFDRSVDLSQFEEDSSLYPICRAWIINQPKADYRKIGRRSGFYRRKTEEPQLNDDSVELPGPEGPTVSKIPSLLPDQMQRNKDNINLNYREATLPSREQLLQSHMSRWMGVKRAWHQQSAKVEARYEATQQLLNKIYVSVV